MKKTFLKETNLITTLALQSNEYAPARKRGRYQGKGLPLGPENRTEHRRRIKQDQRSSTGAPKYAGSGGR